MTTNNPESPRVNPEFVLPSEQRLATMQALGARTSAIEALIEAKVLQLEQAAESPETEHRAECTQCGTATSHWVGGRTTGCMDCGNIQLAS